MQCQAKPRGPVIDGRFGQSRFVPEKEFSLTEQRQTDPFIL